MSDHLYQRGGIWYARIQVEGRDIRRSLHTSSRSEASARLKTALRDAAGYEPLNSSRRRAVVREMVSRNGKQARGNFVYFIQGERGGPIKIGRSKRPKSRIASLQRSSGVRLVMLACVETTSDIEGVLHRRFASDHLHHEWFKSTARLRRFIAEVVILRPAQQPAQSATVRRKLSTEEILETHKIISNFKW